MRNMVKILTVGALVGWLSGGLAYAEGEGGAEFYVVGTQKLVQPGATFTVEVRLSNADNVGAFQFMMKVGSGAKGSLAVKNIVLNKEHPDYVLGAAESLGAFDAQQNRAGGVLMVGGMDVVSGTVATVTLQAPKKQGTYHVGLAAGQETFLRDSSAVPIPVVVGKDLTITVSDRATPSSRKKGRSSR